MNYLPPHPQRETDESLKIERVELLNEVKKRNSSVKSAKMVKTLKTSSLRRQEIINEAPSISGLKDRWPALFDAAQVNVFRKWFGLL